MIWWRFTKTTVTLNRKLVIVFDFDDEHWIVDAERSLSLSLAFCVQKVKWNQIEANGKSYAIDRIWHFLKNKTMRFHPSHHLCSFESRMKPLLSMIDWLELDHNGFPSANIGKTQAKNYDIWERVLIEAAFMWKYDIKTARLAYSSSRSITTAHVAQHLSNERFSIN